MPAVSNGRFLPLLPAPPLPAAGYSVKVYAHTDLYAYAKGRNPTPLAQLYRFQQLSLSAEISDPGAGSITLALADPVFSYALADGRTPDALYRYDNLFVVLQDGQWRGEFFGEKVTINRAGSSEYAGRTVTISGPGAGRALAWAQVMTPYFPRTAPKGTIAVSQYKNLPVMAAWLDLLWAAQRRGTIGYVHCRFNAVKDTGGARWEDTPAPKPKNTATVTLGAVNFTYDSSALTAAGTAALTTIMGKVAATTYPKITVTGHASSEGSSAYNYQKALDRANTVRNFMLAARPLAQITVVSRGETQPVASNRTAAGRAKNRRVVITYQSGSDYIDTVYTPERGTTLLDLLGQLTSGQTTAEGRGPIHCEWLMGKGFELQVRSQIGVDRSKQVVFHEGSPGLAAAADDLDRTDIANLIGVLNDQFVYACATHPASIARWGQREMLTVIEGSYADTVRAQIANNLKTAYANEALTYTLSIVPGQYRMPFRDFGLGDWIGIWRTQGKLPGSVERQRVMAITVTVDAAGQQAYELTLSATRTTRVSWLKMQVDALINRKRGIRPFIQDDEPTGGLPGDLWTPLTRRT